MNLLTTCVEWLRSDSKINIILQLLLTVVTIRLTQRSINKRLLNEIKLQRKQNVADIVLPIFLEILEKLHVLEEAFVYRGKFCPTTEGLYPNLGLRDKEKQTSYARREFQFRKIGYQLIANCRKIVFLTNNQQLSGSLQACKKILSYLTKRDRGKKRELEYLLGRLTDCYNHETQSSLDEKAKQSLFAEISEKGRACIGIT